MCGRCELLVIDKDALEVLFSADPLSARRICFSILKGWRERDQRKLAMFRYRIYATPERHELLVATLKVQYAWMVYSDGLARKNDALYKLVNQPHLTPVQRWASRPDGKASTAARPGGRPSLAAQLSYGSLGALAAAGPEAVETASVVDDDVGAASSFSSSSSSKVMGAGAEAVKPSSKVMGAGAEAVKPASRVGGGVHAFAAADDAAAARGGGADGGDRVSKASTRSYGGLQKRSISFPPQRLQTAAAARESGGGGVKAALGVAACASFTQLQTIGQQQLPSASENSQVSSGGRHHQASSTGQQDGSDPAPLEDALEVVDGASSRAARSVDRSEQALMIIAQSIDELRQQVAINAKTQSELQTSQLHLIAQVAGMDAKLSTYIATAQERAKPAPLSPARAHHVI